jgi:hypothetical protein
MAIGAHDVALSDFLRDRWPAVSFADQATDIVAFVVWLSMVKLQHGEVAKATIHALGVPQKFPQPLTISGLCELVVCGSTRLIGRRITDVVHPRDFADTDTARSNADFPIGIFQAEARNIQDLTTSAAVLRVFGGGRLHPKL